jgi:hypothetical protein
MLMLAPLREEVFGLSMKLLMAGFSIARFDPRIYPALILLAALLVARSCISMTFISSTVSLERSSHK